MLSLRVAFLLSFVQLIRCKDYNALRKDVCFRNIYVCGKYQRSITIPNTNRMFAAIPTVFQILCRENKEFIACVDDAVSNYCNESMSDLARMTLDNRISMKLFCTDPEWQERYFSSALCINKNKELIEGNCRIKGKKSYIGSCDSLEPCILIQKFFNCAIPKTKEFCGATAAEVYKRIMVLQEKYNDVVCEFRRQYLDHCQFHSKKIKNYKKLLELFGFSDSCYPFELSEINLMRDKLLTTFENIKKILLQDVLEEIYSAMEESSNFENSSDLFKRFGSQNNFHLFAEIAEIKRLKNLAEIEQIHFCKNSKVLKDLHLRLKNHLFRFVDTLRHEEIIIGSLTEELFEIYWTKIEFPMQSIVCDKINIASKNVFKCSIKWDLSENESNARSV